MSRLIWEGREVTLTEASELSGLSKAAICARVKRGVPEDRLLEPLWRKRRPSKKHGAPVYIKDAPKSTFKEKQDGFSRDSLYALWHAFDREQSWEIRVQILSDLADISYLQADRLAQEFDNEFMLFKGLVNNETKMD